MKLARFTRRWFLERTGLATIASVGLPRFSWAQTASQTAFTRADAGKLVAALGDTIIPTAEGYPGYRRLEPHGINQEVLKGLEGIEQREFDVFNAAAAKLLGGKPFLEMGFEERSQYLQLIADSFPADTFGGPGWVGKNPAGGSETAAAGKSAAAILGKDEVESVQKLFRLARARILIVFYQNFPQHTIQRDRNKIPVLKLGDDHQILNPNTPELVTGWDVANFPGPLTWSEEQELRARWMKIHWHND